MLRAIRAEKSVGKAIASSSAYVCKDCVPPSAAANASMHVRATLLNGSCSVKLHPLVWQCVLRVSDFEFSINTANGTKTFSSNLDLNLDLSIRKSVSAIRSLQENTHQGVSGRTDISTKFSADYALSDRVNIQLFYDRMVAKYEVATSFDTANNSFGLKLRFTFGS